MPKGNTYKTGALTDNLSGSTWLALFSTNPGADGSGTEVTYSTYERRPITWGLATINGSLGERKNTNLIEFGTVPSTTGQSAAFAAIMTEQTNGEVIYYGPLGASYNLIIGVKPTVPIGSLTATEE